MGENANIKAEENEGDKKQEEEIESAVKAAEIKKRLGEQEAMSLLELSQHLARDLLPKAQHVDPAVQTIGDQVAKEVPDAVRGLSHKLPRGGKRYFGKLTDALGELMQSLKNGRSSLHEAHARGASLWQKEEAR